MSTPNFSMQGNLPYVSPYSSDFITNSTPADLFGLNSASAAFPDMDSPLAFDPLDEAGFLSTAPSGTISPRDLMNDSSVPPSGTFTDMSTPSFESPGNFSQNPSPMFTDLDLAGHEDWPSLFEGAPEMNAFDLAHLEGLQVEAPFKSQPEKPVLQVNTAPRSPLKRSASSMASPPVSATGGTKHSTTSGVNARARKNLTPVEFDPNDPIAAKRARNTEAARKSRAKKMEQQASADQRIAALNKLLAERDEEIANLKAQLQIQNNYQ